MHIVSLNCVISGLVCLGVAGYFLLGICFPRLRLEHYGMGVPMGILSLASAAAWPLGWGTMFFWIGTHAGADIPLLWFAAPFVVSLSGSAFGTAYDFQAFDRKQMDSDKADEDK